NPSLTDELWVDVKRGSAIARHVYFNGKNPWYRLDTKYVETAHGWLPDSWTLTWTSGGKVNRIQRLKVDSLDVSPSITDEDFTMRVLPGMIVRSDQYPNPESGLDPNSSANMTYSMGAEQATIPE